MVPWSSCVVRATRRRNAGIQPPRLSGSQSWAKFKMGSPRTDMGVSFRDAHGKDARERSRRHSGARESHTVWLFRLVLGQALGQMALIRGTANSPVLPHHGKKARPSDPFSVLGEESEYIFHRNHGNVHLHTQRGQTQFISGI